MMKMLEMVKMAPTDMKVVKLKKMFTVKEVALMAKLNSQRQLKMD